MGSSVAPVFEVVPPKASQDKFEVVPPNSSAMDSVKDFASEFWKQVNPVAGFQGAAQMAAHPVESFKTDANARQQVYDAAEAAFKKGDYTTGAAKLMYSLIPLVGPQLNAAASNFTQGNYAKGAGASVGMGVAMAGPQAIADLHPVQALKEALTPEGAPERMYESAMKPGTTIPAPKRAAMVQAGLENEIPVSTSGVEKLGNLVDDLNGKIKDIIAQGSASGKTINKFDVVSNLSDTAKRFTKQVNPQADLNAISESGNEFLESQPNEIPAGEAQDLKTGTYQILRKKYGQLGSATVESQKALARGIKEELVNQFPEIGDLNAQESKLLNLAPSLERAVNRISNHQIMGIGTPIAAGATKAVTGSTGVAAVAGLMKAVFDDPMIKSKIAIALARKGVPETNVFSRLGAYSSALGNAANSSKSADQGNQ